jgi:hypothetical protein
MRKLVITGMAVAMLAIPTVASAAKPTSDDGNGGRAAATHNVNANDNACWGQDRSFYASEQFFGGDMDIKQSFDPALGGVGEQRAAWVAQFCS